MHIFFLVWSFFSPYLTRSVFALVTVKKEQQNKTKLKKEVNTKTSLYILLEGFACRCIRLLFNSLWLCVFLSLTEDFFVLVSDRFAGQQHTHTQTQIHWLLERNQNKGDYIEEALPNTTLACIFLYACKATSASQNSSSRTREKATKRL